jgi:hypothetical protein
MPTSSGANPPTAHSKPARRSRRPKPVFTPEHQAAIDRQKLIAKHERQVNRVIKESGIEQTVLDLLNT